MIVTLRDYVVLCPHAYCLRRERNYLACTFWELVYTEYLQALQRQNARVNGQKVLLFFATIRGWWIRCILQFFLRRADYIIGISRKLSLIYERNLIQVQQVIYNMMEFRKPPRRKQNIWLFVGRKTWGKGIDILLKAYEDVTQKKSVPPLYVMGHGTAFGKYENPGVKFLQHVPHIKYLEYLTRAKLVVVPSQWEEPFGRVALESISQGTPALVTDSGALPEIIEHNKTGIVVRPSVGGLSQGLMLFMRTQHKLYSSLLKRRKFLEKKFFRDPIASHVLLYKSL